MGTQTIGIALWPTSTQSVADEIVEFTQSVMSTKRTIASRSWSGIVPKNRVVRQQVRTSRSIVRRLSGTTWHPVPKRTSFATPECNMIEFSSIQRRIRIKRTRFRTIAIIVSTHYSIRSYTPLSGASAIRVPEIVVVCTFTHCRMIVSIRIRARAQGTGAR